MTTLHLVHEELRNYGLELFERAGRPAQPFGLYVIPATDPAAELARFVEREVFLECFGNSPELLRDEYAAYEESTVFVCLLDHETCLPAGMMRLILPSDAGFKSLDDIERAWGQTVPDVWERTGLKPDASSTLDIATIAIMPDYRGDATEGVLTASMLQALGRFVRGLDLRWVVTIMDTAVLAHLQPLSCFFWHTYVGLEPMSYLDSPESIPVYGDLVEYFPRLERDDPAMYRMLFHGLGLEAIVGQPDWPATISGLTHAVVEI
jgi:hypothetical protein